MYTGPECRGCCARVDVAAIRVIDIALKIGYLRKIRWMGNITEMYPPVSVEMHAVYMGVSLSFLSLTFAGCPALIEHVGNKTKYRFIFILKITIVSLLYRITIDLY